jgi:chromosome segregation ATPase
MEGVLNNVAEKVSEIRSRLDRHEKDISDLKLTTQQLASDAIAKDLTVIATAKALSEAKEAADAAAQSEVQRSNSRWTPLERLSTGLGAVAAIIIASVTTYLAMKP